MFELIFRDMFKKLRANTVEVIYRLEKRTGKNEKIELFCQKRAEMFPRDPRGCIRFVFYFGIYFGWLLAKEGNAELEDLFTVTDLSPEAKKRLQ